MEEKRPREGRSARKLEAPLDAAGDGGRGCAALGWARERTEPSAASMPIRFCLFVFAFFVFFVVFPLFSVRSSFENGKTGLEAEIVFESPLDVGA